MGEATVVLEGQVEYAAIVAEPIEHLDRLAAFFERRRGGDRRASDRGTPDRRGS